MEIKDPKLWDAFEKYCLWRSIPKHFCLKSEQELEELGLSSDVIDLAKIRYKKDFAEKFLIDVSKLYDWDKHPELLNNIKKNWKSWGKSLTPNIVGKFYEKALVEADAGRFKAWMEHVEEENKEENTVNVNVAIEKILQNMVADGDIKTEQQENANGSDLGKH